MPAGEWKVMEHESMTGNEPSLLYLSHADVCRVLPMADAIGAMHEAFSQFPNGRVTMPARSSVEIPVLYSNHPQF